MGLFSGITKALGLGGGSSGNSTSSTSNNIKVEPVTNVNFDTKDLALAIQSGNENNIAIATANLKQNAINNANLFHLEQQKNKKLNEAINSIQSFIPFITISAIYLIYIKKKGGK